MHQITLQNKTICETNFETWALGLSTLDCPPEELYKYVSIVHNGELGQFN